MNIKNLPHGKAVLLGNVYIVSLPYGKKVKVNGVEVNTSCQVCVESLDLIQEVVPASSVLTHYELNGVRRSIKEYNDSIHINKEYWDHLCEDFVYPSLEVEFEVRSKIKEASKFEPVFDYTPETTRQYSVDVIGVTMDTGSDFIESSIQYGMATYNVGSSVYCINDIKGIICDELEKLIKEYDSKATYNYPDVGCRYLKVNEKYIFGKDDTPDTSTRFFTDIESARLHEGNLRRRVRTRALPFVSKVSIGLTERGDLVRSLISLKDAMNSCDFKKASTYSKKIMSLKIDDIIKSIGLGSVQS
jgi:hypothetical protein